MSNMAIIIEKALYSRIVCNFRYCNNFMKKIDFTCSVQSSPIYNFLSTSSLVNNLPTAKGWKLAYGIQDHSCEDGRDAVLHNVVMNELQKCNTISEQITTFCSKVTISPEDTENRKQFCHSLCDVLTPYFPKCKIYLFGSSVNGLGFKGCDADVSIQTVFDEENYVADVKAVPTLDEVIQGSISADTVAHLPPRFLLRLIRRIFRKHCSDIKEPIILVKARCPILKFYNKKYNIFCDFSCANLSSLRNTQLIQLLCLLEERFSILAKLIRYWGKYEKLIGDIDQFNSYSFSLLLVHFLQHTHPPVLPPLKDIIEKSDYLRQGHVTDNELLLEDVKKFKQSKNTQTVEELLREFFFYFLNFDFSTVMVPLTSSVLSKSDFPPNMLEFSTVTVQDPFRLDFNVTAAASYKNCKRFLCALVKVCRMYQDETLWCPDIKTWGICSLFHKSLSDNEYLSDLLQDNGSHTVKLPLKTSAALVKKILQQGLLFECHEFKRFNNDDVLQPSLKFKCTVYHCTWQGRNVINQNCPQSISNPLERENWISNEILKNKVQSKKQLNFMFLCECVENKCDNELSITLDFKKSRCPSTLSLFLKEYIPFIYEKLTM